jgi:hypothetical protein
MSIGSSIAPAFASVSGEPRIRHRSIAAPPQLTRSAAQAAYYVKDTSHAEDCEHEWFQDDFAVPAARRQAIRG